MNLVSASEIAQLLKTGAVHLGVTGEDLIREAMADADDRVRFLSPLGFGHADVVAAVPDCWLDVRRMADLEQMAVAFRRLHGRRVRVATKYMGLTRRYFSQMGVTGYRIVESLGATEGAPAAGLAELIVDITTTGATLKANGLRVLDDGVILKSQANFDGLPGRALDARADGARGATRGAVAALEKLSTGMDHLCRPSLAPAGPLISGGSAPCYHSLAVCSDGTWMGPSDVHGQTAGAWTESWMARGPGGSLRPLPPGSQQWGRREAGISSSYPVRPELHGALPKAGGITKTAAMIEKSPSVGAERQPFGAGNRPGGSQDLAVEDRKALLVAE